MILAPTAVKVAGPRRKRKSAGTRPKMKERFNLNGATLKRAQVAIHQSQQRPIHVHSSLAEASITRRDYASSFAQVAFDLVSSEFFIENGFSNAWQSYKFFKSLHLRCTSTQRDESWKLTF